METSTYTVRPDTHCAYPWWDGQAELAWEVIRNWLCNACIGWLVLWQTVLSQALYKQGLATPKVIIKDRI